MDQNLQPINISSQNVEGNCDQKCSYNFKYTETNLNAKNNGIMISLTCDDSNNPPVIYNKEKYNVSNILLVSPSIHLFNSVSTNAELLIEHVPVKGGPNLLVCVPIIESTNSSTSGNLLTEIIQNVVANAPSEGETTNLNLSNFTLNDIVPKQPFFTYTGNDPNNSTSNFIVFNIIDGIPLTTATLTSLSQIIKPFPAPTLGGNLFYNSSGPNNAIPEGIYISCQPTGSSTDETDVSYSKNTTSFDMSLFNNPYSSIIIQAIIGCFIFILVFLIINYAYTYITSNPIKLPKINMPTIK